MNLTDEFIRYPAMSSLLICYHSQSGSCVRLAQAAWRGARQEEGATVSAMRAWDAGIGDLRGADGLLLVVAENSGSLSGGGKDFLDRVFYPAIDAELVLPFALVISAGNDGRGARRQAQTILSGIPFTPAAEPVICRGPVTGQHLTACEALGLGLAAGLGMGIY